MNIRHSKPVGKIGESGNLVFIFFFFKMPISKVDLCSAKIDDLNKIKVAWHISKKEPLHGYPFFWKLSISQLGGNLVIVIYGALSVSHWIQLIESIIVSEHWILTLYFCNMQTTFIHQKLIFFCNISSLTSIYVAN